LKALLAGETEMIPGHIVHLSRAEEQILRMLMARSILTKDAFLTVREAEGHDAEVKILDVFICKIRKKLEPFGIVIETVWGKGYTLNGAMKERVRELASRPAPAPETMPGVGRYRPGPSLQQYADAKAAVMALLRDRPEGLTWYAIRRAVNISDARLHQVIPALLNCGEAERMFARKGNTFVYRLAERAS